MVVFLREFVNELDLKLSFLALPWTYLLRLMTPSYSTSMTYDICVNLFLFNPLIGSFDSFV